MQAAKTVIEKYLLLWLLLSSGLAFGSAAFAQLLVRSGGAMTGVIAITMFAIGWMLPREEVSQVLVRWPNILGGTATQYVAMPALAFLMANAFGFAEPLLIGVVMVGCVPGAMASNVLTLTAGGNTSYSVGLTTTATLLSPLIVPLALKLTLGASVPSAKILEAAITLTWMVVLPVVTGHLISRNVPQARDRAATIGSLVANLTILWIVAVVVASNRDNLWSLDMRLLGCLLAINLLGYLAGYGSGSLMRLPGSMRRALTLEVGMQNAGLGAALVKELFPGDPRFALPAALYTFGCMLTGTVLAALWRYARHGKAAADSTP